MTFVTYVGNETVGTVSVVPQGASSPSRTITGFDENLFMANSPDGSLIYVTNPAANTVSVIETATNAIINTISVGNSPQGVAFSPDGTTAYVVNSVDDTVSIIDVASHSVTGVETVGSGMDAIAVSPEDATKAYIAAPALNIVYSFNTSTYAVSSITDSGSTFNEPANVAFTPDGTHAYVTNYGSDTVSIINVSTGAVTGVLTVGSNPNGLVMNPNGNYAYVANTQSNTVSIITLSGPSVSGDFIMPGTNPQPQAVSITSDSAVLYAALGNAAEIVPIALATGGSSGTVGSVISVGSVPLSILTIQPTSIPMTNPYTAPQGRLTLTSNTPVMTSDVAGATSIYYAPYQGDLVPLYNGTSVSMYELAGQLTMALNTSNHLSGKIYDLFVFLNSSVLTIGAGPAWSSTASRGTGSGTTQLQQTSGLWTNAEAITPTNGSTTYGSVPAGEATYLGSFYATANGQTAMQFAPAWASGGTNNMLALYNAYNRVEINSQCVDSTTDWTYSTYTLRPANGSTSNRVNWLDGLQQSSVRADYKIQANCSSGNYAFIYMGLNSTTSSLPVGAVAQSTLSSLQAFAGITPQLGFNYVQALENSLDGTGVTFYAGAEMTLSIILEM